MRSSANSGCLRLVDAVLIALVAASCAPGERRDPFGFSEGFLFGSAIAGFQAEMGCPTLPAARCTDDSSDWYAYVTSAALQAEPLTHLAGDDPAVSGPGHWELYEQDYALARDVLHNDAFRTSIEWSRIFPRSTEGIEGHEALRAVADLQALEHYRAMLRAMRAHGLRPFITLHHYTLPRWLHDAVGCTEDLARCRDRGWLDAPRLVPEIAKYAGFVARELGAEVDLWATQNEPFAVVLSGFVQPTPLRSNPPAALLQSAAARTAFVAMVEAHARMVDAVRAGDRVDADGDGEPALVGVVHAMAPVLPADAREARDREAAKNVFYVWNLLFLDATALGELDQRIDGTPRFREDLADRMDFIGLNYKMSMRVSGLGRSLLPALSPLLTFNPLLLELDEIHPRGLLEMCELLARRYRLPVIVSENNGQQLWRGDAAAEDRYVAQNLQWLAQAVRRGVDVRGYFYWSFMDNYEWNHGTAVRLGLFAVDPADPAKRRTPRSTAGIYGAVAAARAVPAALRREHPIALEEPPTGGVPLAP